jgi:DNA repair protein RadA/Sms
VDILKRKTKFVCTECGYESPKWMGKCPGCNSWNTLLEEEVYIGKNNRKGNSNIVKEKSVPTPISKVEMQDEPRTLTSYLEFNRVLGGGVVKGSLVLIGGDPGIGKSTLLLQISADISKNSKKVLYVSGEESSRQIKLRADRLGINNDGLLVLAENDLEIVVNTIDNLKPDFVVIDSIQTIFLPHVTSAPGSVSQVRECTAEIMKVAKQLSIPIFIVGHVTKEGAIAGPRMLEHMVDTVLYFEGERHHTFRILRAVKNRFGSTNEIGIFEMKESGLAEVLNPSEIFLEERSEGTAGSVVVASMEGTRPVLVELQSLISPSCYGNPRRMTTGIDQNKVVLIMAVLEKRVGLLLQNQDAYVKIAGGVKLDEPAVDLAVAISIASSYKDKKISTTDVFIGEVGLTGEVRRVSRIDQRVTEAAKLGFKRAIVPKRNLSGWNIPNNIEVIGVNDLGEAIRIAFTETPF